MAEEQVGASFENQTLQGPEGFTSERRVIETESDPGVGADAAAEAEAAALQVEAGEEAVKQAEEVDETSKEAKTSDDKKPPIDIEKHAKGLEVRLNKETTRRKQTERDFKEFSEKIYQQMEELRNPPPNPDEDPEGATAHELASMKKELEAFKKANTPSPAQVRQREIEAYALPQEKSDPEFAGAFEHWKESFIAEAIDYGETDDGALEVFSKVAWDAAEESMHRNRNWSAYVKAEAKRAGWKPNGKAEDVKVDAEKEDEEADLETIAEGQNTARGVGGKRGGPKPLTLKNVSAITDPDERQRAFKELMNRKR